MPLLLVAFTLPESLLTSMVTRPCSLVKRWRWCTNQELAVTYLNSGGKVGDTLKAIVTCDKCGSYLHWQGVFPDGTNTRMQLEKHWHIPPSNSQTAKEKLQRVAATQSKSSPPSSTLISGPKSALQLADAFVVQLKLTRTRYVALAWKDPRNIVEQLSPKP